MKKDITRLLIETKLRQTLSDAEIAPERNIRNLLELGLSISKGRFQTSFLTVVQQIVQNEKSAYFKLLKDLLSNTDKERLIHFGVNIGYESCTRGAKIIRKIEEAYGFNIPWALSLEINAKKQEDKPNFYPSVIEQGMNLGIHTYLLFLPEKPECILPILQQYENCAFILFMNGIFIHNNFADKLSACNNSMVAVLTDENYSTACKILRKKKLLYSAWLPYESKDVPALQSGKWLDCTSQAHPVFAFLLPHTKGFYTKEVYQYILSVRTQPPLPIFPIELMQDLLRIDKIISDDICLVGFDKNGVLRTNDINILTEQYNIFDCTLRNILKSVMKKERSA